MSRRAHQTHQYRLMGTLLTAAMLGLTGSPGFAGENDASFLRQIAWQSGLDRVGLSPGVIDGRIGSKTLLATREFQRVRGLPMTGQLDAATAKALEIDLDNIIGHYTIQAADLAEIGPVPTSWLARSKLKRLGHESLTTVLAEKFHCTRGLLATLNPGRDINGLKAGQKVIVPIVAEPAPATQASRLEINLTDKIIRAINEQNQLVGLFHCSVAASKSKLPSGQARIECIVPNPSYTFDPAKWPEVKEKITSKLTIPPGPRNPVGRVWIGLNLPGYGIHGTPNPELIGKTGSHGCIRLANWDALRLSKMMRVGAPITFTIGSKNK